MRLARVPLFFAVNAEGAVESAAENSRTTHDAQSAGDACRYFAGLIIGALRGVGNEVLLEPRYCPLAGYWDRNRRPVIDEVASGSFKGGPPLKSGAPATWSHPVKQRIGHFTPQTIFARGAWRQQILGTMPIRL